MDHQDGSQTVARFTGRDGFTYHNSSPNLLWHKAIDDFLAGLQISYWLRVKHAEQPSIRLILESPPADQVAATVTLILRRIVNEQSFHSASSRSAEASDCANILQKLTVFLLGRVPLSGAHDVISILSPYQTIKDRRFCLADASAQLKLCERFLKNGAMTPELRQAIETFATALRPDEEDKYEATDWRRTREAFEEILRVSTVSTGEASQTTDVLNPIDPWAVTISDHVRALDQQTRSAWNKLLAHSSTATQTKPSGKWLKEAGRLLESVGREKFKTQIIEWFPLIRPSFIVDKMAGYAHEPMLPANADALRGLVWICSFYDDEGVTRAVSDLCQMVYKKLPNWGALSAKVGNACLFTLSQLPGLAPVSQLSRLRLKVKYSQALLLIERAMAEAAAKLGMTAEELEEIAVPTYGLDADGCLREEFGSFTAELKIIGTHDTELRWLKADGKSQPSIPAEVKEAHGEDLKELKRTVQDIEKMLPAQCQRIESLLASERAWTLENWLERYLNHPLLAQITRRLIWHFQSGSRSALGIWHQGKLVDIHNQPFDWLSSQTQVRLWHPIGSTVEGVAAWRSWLETNEVAQPFKQAHREIYVLTDAEVRTNTYSNRFAGHIIRQHQFSALAQQRGWVYRLQGAFDSHNTPILFLPQWNLRVEFWVQGDTNEISDHGICLYLSTDQVRFCRDGEPVSLQEVPALVFSEAMRDIDLFTGVCSIGNDPAWQDRGENPHQAYWREFSFGGLSVSAKTRKEILEKLVPRLKIAARCSFKDNFLVVRGDLRTYKIHLGSSNILMEPNDQYLCIVPDRSSAVKATEKVFLPFEGDQTMAIILSKAFLLAEDTKIKDSSITRQIKGT